MKISKMELISGSGKTHAIVENPEEFKKMGIDIIEEMGAIMETQAILDSEGNDDNG